MATLREPPKHGSVRELLLLLYILKKQQVEHTRWRALAQTVIDKEKGVTAFDEYMKVAFPWIESAKKKDAQEMAKVLLREIRGGPLKITPTNPARYNSNLRTKVVSASQVAKKDWLPVMDRVFKKMGNVIPGEES